MTHDELLARISLENKQLVSYEEFEKRNSALRAIVELHKPWNIDHFGESVDVCHGCLTNYSEESYFKNIGDNFVKYPCPTIQAIEKELNG